MPGQGYFLDPVCSLLCNAVLKSVTSAGTYICDSVMSGHPHKKFVDTGQGWDFLGGPYLGHLAEVSEALGTAEGAASKGI